MPPEGHKCGLIARMKKWHWARIMLGLVGAAGLVCGTIIAFSTQAAGTLLVVSLALVVIAFFGDRLQNLHVKVGEAEIVAALSAAAVTVSEVEARIAEAAEVTEDADVRHQLKSESRELRALDRKLGELTWEVASLVSKEARRSPEDTVRAFVGTRLAQGDTEDEAAQRLSSRQPDREVLNKVAKSDVDERVRRVVAKAVKLGGE
ncbi:membrane protein [Gordonia phage Bradissa]|nr:membrane protein [Gordonia phage Bradissa]